VGRMAGLAGLLIALGVIYVVYNRSLAEQGLVQAPPQQQIDVIGVRSELLAIGQAERQYLVAHGTYGTLDELEGERLLTGGADRRGYVFTVAVDGSRGFTVTAAPSGTERAGWPTLTMNETMEIAGQ